jgi:tetratricopeptide (TPR) repeat protein
VFSAVGGVHMKSIIILVLLLLLSSGLHAQERHHPANISNTPATTPFGSVDVMGPLRSDIQPRPAPGNSQRDNLVPVSQLRIPAKAVKEYERARKAFQHGDVDFSANHLQKALHIYPDFIQAHNVLGLCFIQLGDYQKALAEHEAALALDPHRVETHQDLSLALLSLNRFQEAEDEARQALQLDSNSVAARYTLGRAIIGQGHASAEAIEMLRRSEDAFSDASLVLAQIHFSAGRTDQVVADLRHYLRSPLDPDNKHTAECWVAQLSQQPAPAGCPAEVTRPSFR